jgi:hypothetical protein
MLLYIIFNNCKILFTVGDQYNIKMKGKLVLVLN